MKTWWFRKIYWQNATKAPQKEDVRGSCLKSKQDLSKKETRCCLTEIGSNGTVTKGSCARDVALQQDFSKEKACRTSRPHLPSVSFFAKPAATWAIMGTAPLQFICPFMILATSCRNLIDHLE